MNLSLEHVGDVVTVRPSGRLDIESAVSFQQSLEALLREGHFNIVIDLANVPYMSSAGLRVFVHLAKLLAGKGQLAVSGLAGGVKQVFDLVAFNKLMPVCDTAEAARQKLSEPR
jgi:anti-anti-sigma factor